ncbi:hypothetical protein Taro_004993 [Colocasia esculenta]|uniref:Uncharacterized protein n=1 Tax=Colocasia esculenta TaxID=4460 RepID=A0A843TT72_COLES|nr:hypothetical protein [Colocasia esculenta]
MFHGEYDPDKTESWTHELERIFETMECAEEDQRFSEVFHGEYFPDYARRERRDQFHALVQGDLTFSQYYQRYRVSSSGGSTSSRYRVSSSGGSTSSRLSSFCSRSNTSRTSSSSSTLSSYRSSISPSRRRSVGVGRARHCGYGVVTPERFAVTALGRAAPGRRVLVATGVAVSDVCSIDVACLGVATAFLVSEALVLRWCRPARAGDAFVPFGARRRCLFLREGPNGFILRMEVGTLDPLTLSMLPSPLYIVLPLWFRAWECENSMLEVERVPELPPAGNTTPLEAAILSRWPGRPRQDRDALGCRDLVTTAWAIATGSRQGRASRPCRDGPMRSDLSRETSQQRQGARRAEETGRCYCWFLLNSWSYWYICCYCCYFLLDLLGFANNGLAFCY